MKTDAEIINAMILQDEKDAMREDMLRDEAYERRLRNDIDFFLEQNGFDKLQEDYNKLHKKMWDYGWYDKLKDYL